MKQKMKMILKRVLMIAQGFMPLVIFLCIWNIIILNPQITNPYLYPIIYNSEVKGYEELLAHFPGKIPDNATDVKFYYIPKVLQGSMHIKLEFKASKEAINSYLEKYDNNVYCKCNAKFAASKNSYRLSDLYGINLNRDRDDVIIYLIKTTGPINHGHVAFIAVNEEHTEILFEAERW